MTLGVQDLEISLKFYRDTLGWPAKLQEDIVFIPLQNGIVLGLYGRQALADDATVPNTQADFSGVTFGHNVESIAAVDAIFVHLKAAGTRIVRPPQKMVWGGYSGYFADPDGYLWEVVYNPSWKLGDTGSVDLG